MLFFPCVCLCKHYPLCTWAGSEISHTHAIFSGGNAVYLVTGCVQKKRQMGFLAVLYPVHTSMDGLKHHKV